MYYIGRKEYYRWRSNFLADDSINNKTLGLSFATASSFPSGIAKGLRGAENLDRRLHCVYNIKRISVPR